MLKKLFIIASVLVVICIFQTQNTFACRCIAAPRSVSEATDDYLKKADAVFLGEVISMPYRKMSRAEIKKLYPKSEGQEGKIEMMTVKIKVSRWWKGFRAKEVTLLTETYKLPDNLITSNSCEFSFTVGRRFLVFAYGKDLKTLRTYSCSGTSSLENRSEHLKFLGKGFAPK